MKRMARFLLIAFVLLVLVSLLLRTDGEPAVADGSVLLFELSGRIVEGPPPALLSRLVGRRQVPLLEILSELAKAERDERLSAVVIRIGALDIGWAKARELHDAIARLRESGRHPVAYLELERFGANLEHYVASAAEEVYVAPGTRTPFVGLAAEYLFLGGLWEKLGIAVEVERIGDYKSAAEAFAGKEMSEPHREMAESLLDSIESEFVAGIARGRGLEEAAVRRAIAQAPVEGSELVAHGLVDGVAFRDEVVEKLGDGPTIEASDYARVSLESVGFDPKARFAIVYGSGPVVVGEGDPGMSGRSTLASEAVSEALEQAADAPEIEAIIFRIDSPGGSALASDLVWHAVQRARAKKPVIASMSDVAASGGYYVAAGSDAIVAQPGTLTGSIGVFVLRPVVGGLLAKLGIGFETLTRGEHAALLTGTRPLSEKTRARLRQEVTSVYTLFVDRVAEGRGLDASAVDAIGQGRVWTGAQALDHQLVDALGGVRAAVDEGRERLGLAPTDDVALSPYPPPKPLAEQIRDVLGGGLGVELSGAPLPVGALAEELLAWLRPLPTGSPVLLPPIAVRVR